MGSFRGLGRRIRQRLLVGFGMVRQLEEALPGRRVEPAHLHQARVPQKRG